MKARVVPKRGFVYRVTLNYIDRSAEPNEKHMVIVIQNNGMLKQAKEVNVLEITSNLHNVNAPYNVFLPADTLPGKHQISDSKIKGHVLYGVEIEDLLNGEFCGQIPNKIMKKIGDAIIFSLGLLEDD
jgi:mRNA-degrading endonuclease toxin of MazEF toxin-antitoxin module